MDETAPDATDPLVGEILAIVAKETAVDRAALRPAATIQELGIASIDMVQALFALESHFDIEIPVVADRAGAEFTTVADLTAHVIAAIERTSARVGATTGGTA